MFSSFASFVFHSNSEKKLLNKFPIVQPAELLLSRRPMMLMMMAAVKGKMKYWSKGKNRKRGEKMKEFHHTDEETENFYPKKSNLINLLPFNVFTLFCDGSSSDS